MVPCQPEGAAAYLAPEQLATGGSSEQEGAAGPKADVWAFGAVLVHMLSGSAPLAGSSGADTCSKAAMQRQEPPQLPQQAHSSPALARLLQGCFASEPSGRPGAAEALRLLSEAVEAAGASAQGELLPEAKTPSASRVVSPFGAGSTRSPDSEDCHVVVTETSPCSTAGRPEGNKLGGPASGHFVTSAAILTLLELDMQAREPASQPAAEPQQQQQQQQQQQAEQAEQPQQPQQAEQAEQAEQVEQVEQPQQLQPPQPPQPPQPLPLRARRQQLQQQQGLVIFTQDQMPCQGQQQQKKQRERVMLSPTDPQPGAAAAAGGSTPNSSGPGSETGGSDNATTTVWPMPGLLPASGKQGLHPPSAPPCTPPGSSPCRHAACHDDLYLTEGPRTCCFRDAVPHRPAARGGRSSRRQRAQQWARQCGQQQQRPHPRVAGACNAAGIR